MFTLTPCSAALGAEVNDLDLSAPLADDTIQGLREAWAEHLILVFRGQQLDDQQLVQASGLFGVCDRAPPNEAAVKGPGHVAQLPEVTVISNVVEDGNPIGSLGHGELVWHTDMSYHETPADASALYAIELPAGGGGETSFLNMYAAYESLPQRLKDALRDKQAIHDFTYTSAGTLRKGFAAVDDVRDAPGARHTMLRTHPVTGRTALFLGRRVNSYVLGLSVDESEALLDEVWGYVIDNQPSYSHQWRLGDLVLWDNRCVMHRREQFNPADRRVMHRTQLAGERPYFSN
ncbi:MAG: TauD/TfdA family dioxygenase [Chromatiales bacterium]|jgi:taurine dioxygenase|nr:TauD/TfdA family dioxygenase [Chromatiales bacterium]